ncbi:cytochrome c biogenesis protein CcdA [Pontiella sp.]|uniref:protein-disulfide reductase DsbD family protein n=1 Tax=Pontiella sp. TaxID=2837462 RepID=UPI003563B345
MKKIRFAFLFSLLSLVSAFAQFGDPFTVTVTPAEDRVHIEVTVPDAHYLYAENFTVTDALGNQQEAVTLPPTKSITDPNSGKPKPVYDVSFEAEFKWMPKDGGAAAVHVKYWGCNDEVCFIPQTKVVELEVPAGAAVTAPAETAGPGDLSSDWKAELENFNIQAMHSGGLNAEQFLDFLDQSETTVTDAQSEPSAFKLFVNDPVAFVRESGLLLTILFILVGGLALNLTPCVLPMIPINLAIIGAGAQAGSKGRGFALGAVYGLGIALVYGLLGVIVVLTGSQFGTIQANPWFNLVIAAIFVVLALAMFDVFHIDFSRFQSRLGGGEHKQGSFIVALSMGSVAALLAGACVAPVVIAVLLLATNIYEANPAGGLALPFILGIGMALPWPFAGGGLSCLPKPGKWMEYVKYAFGIGIIFFALYYGHLSYRAFNPAEVVGGIDGRTNAGFAEALAEAVKSDTPVVLDFTASWCKNCAVMEKTTFKDEMVKAELENYRFLKYVAEDPDNPNTKAVMQHFGAQGLPTLIVLQPK